MSHQVSDQVHPVPIVQQCAFVMPINDYSHDYSKERDLHIPCECANSGAIGYQVWGWDTVRQTWTILFQTEFRQDALDLAAAHFTFSTGYEADDMPMPPLFERRVGSAFIPTVNARDLHAKLEVGRDFSTWIQGKLRKYGFVEGRDFVMERVIPRSGENLGGRPSKEYHLTIRTCQHLSMVENNPRGEQMRDYFIACEERLMREMAEKLSRLEHERDPFAGIALMQALTPKQVDFIRALYLVQREHMVPLIQREVSTSLAARIGDLEGFLTSHIDGRLGLDTDPTVSKTIWHAINYGVKRLGGRAGHIPVGTDADLSAPAMLGAEIQYLTATEVCWSVIGKESLHPRVPARIARALTDHARTQCWQQGATHQRTIGGRLSPTFPADRVATWLDETGRVQIVAENDRLHERPSNVVSIRA